MVISDDAEKFTTVEIRNKSATMETVLVSVSGPAFSLLLYENDKCEFDQVRSIFVRH